MNPGFARTAAVALLAGLSLACRTTNGKVSFLLFGGPDSPQADLVDRVEGAQEESREIEQDFTAAFQLYQRLSAPQAVELEELSDDFSDSLDSCENRAEDLAERLEDVRRDADQLFKGWNEELARFSGDALRKKSEVLLLDTQTRTQRVLVALEHLQERMRPVLLKLQDYALFFNHNLTARAIATLQDTYKEFDGEFKALQAELVRSQKEIAEFLAFFEEPRPATQGR